MTVGTLLGKDRTPQQLLEEFVIGNSELQRLEGLLRKFNLFDALRLVRHEERHSDFLAYMLDPQQNHGLHDSFLKSFLQAALTGGDYSVNPIEIDIWNLTSAEVRREWENRDIFIRDEANHLAVIIENKIGTGEHSNQLARYYDAVCRECPGWNIVPIYLTVEGKDPSDERFIALGYDEVSDLLETLIDLNRNALNPDVRMMIEHYVEMLRRHLVSESEISQLCRKIYDKHKEALDLIFEHRPDRQETVRKLLDAWIKATPELVLDHSSKTYINFVPKSLDTSLLRRGSGWTKSGRMLLFDAHNCEDHLTLRLFIGPGPTDVRRKLLDFASNFGSPLKPSTTSLNAKWNAIFARKIATSKAYTLPDDEFKVELEKEWKKFLENDLPAIISAFDGEKWIREAAGATA
ncbi:MAG TPA: PD-(D/E)XK nuclease family protein [Terriglobales bacterium]|jgi:hypothetical protein|nr:PD-(D/E)XK nuclease family protein [Terriglobales bacterium]